MASLEFFIGPKALRIEPTGQNFGLDSTIPFMGQEFF